MAGTGFTKQQLTGGPRYSHALLGNYSEDHTQAELAAKDYELKRSRGQLLSLRQQRQGSIMMQTVPHSYAPDGFLRYGDSIQLKTEEEDFHSEVHTHFLACNLWQTVDHTKGTTAATCISASEPVARNVFVVTPKAARAVVRAAMGDTATPAGAAAGGGGGSRFAAPPPGAEKAAGDIVCFGDVFSLASNPSLRADPTTSVVAPPYYLVSERPDNITGSGSGNRNEVCMSLVPDSASLWSIVPADGDLLAVEGTPVPVGSAVQVMHRATNRPLAASLDLQMPTDFGNELVAHAFKYVPNTITSSAKGRPAQSQNRWVVVTASTPEAAVDDRHFVELTPAMIMDKVKAVLLERNGVHGIRGLGRMFRIIDDGGDGGLDREDFKWGLYDYGVRISDQEFTMLLDAFDTNGDGVISFDEFLVALRGDMSPARLAVVQEAFEKLDVTGDGKVTLADLEKLYDASHHQEVLQGKKTQEEVLSDFLSQWDTIDQDGVVSLEEFQRYYRDVSASVDTDEYFEQMVRNAWRLEGADQFGGDGSILCKVVFKTGRQTEAVIPPGLARAHQLTETSPMRALVEVLEEEMGVLGVYRASVVPRG